MWHTPRRPAGAAARQPLAPGDAWAPSIRPRSPAQPRLSSTPRHHHQPHRAFFRHTLKGVGDLLLDENNVAAVAWPGTSLARPATGSAVSLAAAAVPARAAPPAGTTVQRPRQPLSAPTDTKHPNPHPRHLAGSGLKQPRGAANERRRAAGHGLCPARHERAAWHKPAARHGQPAGGNAGRQARHSAASHHVRQARPRAQRVLRGGSRVRCRERAAVWIDIECSQRFSWHWCVTYPLLLRGPRLAPRFVRLGTASMAAEPGGPFINPEKLDLRKYAARPNLAR